jgi:bla regulator protein BlaR1
MNPIDTVFEWLLAATLRASVLAVAIFSIRFLVRRWLPANWRHALWLPMVAVLVLPVLPAMPFRWLPVPTENRVEAVSSAALASGDSQVENLAASQAIADPRGGVGVLTFLAIGWLVGACGVIVIGFYGYWRTLRRIWASAVLPSDALRAEIASAATEVRLKRLPQVWVSPAVDSPAVTGLLRPVLLLPAGFPHTFTAEEARMVLLHELSHLKRHDLPLNWLTCVLQALHWFNPVLWFAFARMRADREAACDARVLSVDSIDRRATYGGALLKLQGIHPTPAMALGFVGLFERGSEMKSRIRGISAYRPSQPAGRVTGSALVASLFLFGATKAQEAPKDSPAEVIPASDRHGKLTGGKKYITDKLNTLVVPQIQLENASLEEAVDFLRLRATQLDTAEPDPTKKGINFVIRAPRGVPGKPAFEYGSVGMTLKNVSLMKALVEVTQQAGAAIIVDDFAVTILPRNEANARDIVQPKIAAAPAVAQPKAIEAAGKIVIPQIDFEEVSLKQAVEFLNAKAKELGQGQAVPVISVDAKAVPAGSIRELRLRNAPLSVVLMYCAEQVKLRLEVGEKEIKFSPQS